MDEIDYFPKRDKYKARKNVGSDWNKLKKQTKKNTIRKIQEENNNKNMKNNKTHINKSK